MLDNLDRDSNPTTPVPEALTGVMCPVHQQDQAIGFCQNCENPMCSSCQKNYPGGVSICTHCAASPLNRLPSGTEVKKVRRTLPLIMCANHPESSAVVKCHSCQQGVCVTCEFELPNALVVCPTCIVNAEGTISNKRKWKLLFSTLAGGISWALLIGVVVMGAMGQASAIADVLLSTISIFFCAGGFGLALSTVDQRLYTPIWAWLPVCLNGVTMLIYLMLTVVNLLN